jgi:hypothetical protein
MFKWKFKKKIFEIELANVTNKTTETSIKNHIYHHTIPHKTVICNSDGMTGNRISHR